jgi:hypothetical protein
MTSMSGNGRADTGARAGLWRTWLMAVGGGLILFGTGMGLLAGTPAFGPLHGLIDPAFWPAGPSDPGTLEFRSWAYGVWGAALAGWGVSVVFLAREMLGRGKPWAWRALAFGTGLWFVLDSSVSAIHGVWINAAINVVVLALVALPLAATRPSRET